MIPPDEPLSVPIRPAPTPPAAFPLLVTLAPLAASGVIWFVTGSAFALIFAVLSPVIAVASMGDARRTQRKAGVAARRKYDEELSVLRGCVRERHADLRSARRKSAPSVKSILAEPTGPGRWRGTAATVVSLGLGEVSIDLRISGSTDPREHRALRLWANTLTDAPITADARGGIGIVGPVALSRACARGVLVQLCFALPPNECTVLTVPGDGWAWTDGLPHTLPVGRHAISVRECGQPQQPDQCVQPDRRERWEGSELDLWVIVAERLQDLPPGCATVVRLDGPYRAVVVTSPTHPGGLEFHPELVSAEEAASFAAEARHQACRAGLLARAVPVPRVLSLAQLACPSVDGARRGAPVGLACPLGRGEGGDMSVDLVRSGPHAVVGGTTGSGKSELLVTWVTALAAAYTPAQVTFLLVDFKGGVAFRPLCGLPHCVGLVTDLDADAAARTLASLSAELRYRERVLGAAQAADVADARVAQGGSPLPRLVIVVDEFATMLSVFPQLHALFVDVAARGRSLGVHLILCTQRPAGVVRDALLANCSLRISLRVNNAADSQAVIGTDAAARLSVDLPGRCLIATPSHQPQLCQVATTEVADIQAVIHGWPQSTHDADSDSGSLVPGALATDDPATGAPAVRRPWLDPLPPVVIRSDMVRAADEHADGLVLGLLDDPERQRYVVGRWNPVTDGHLLVVGGARSGKTTLLETLAAQAPCEVVPADVEGTWDALARARHRLESGCSVPDDAHVLLLDDFDAVCARWEPEHRLDALDMLTGLLRDGATARVFLVVCVQRLTGALQNLTSMCQNTLLLRLPTVAEHQSAGGASVHFDATLPPGGGRWRGLRVQLLAPEVSAAGPSMVGVLPSAPGIDWEHPVLVVSRGSGGAGERWRAATGGRSRIIDLTATPALSGGERLEVTDAVGNVVIIGDAEAWQTQWALLATLRTRATLVFEGSSLADFRIVSRRRELPPPLAPGRGHAWALHTDGTVTRVSMPVVPVRPSA